MCMLQKQKYLTECLGLGEEWLRHIFQMGTGEDHLQRSWKRFHQKQVVRDIVGKSWQVRALNLKLNEAINI